MIELQRGAHYSPRCHENAENVEYAGVSAHFTCRTGYVLYIVFEERFSVERRRTDIEKLGFYERALMTNVLDGFCHSDKRVKMPPAPPSNEHNTHSGILSQKLFGGSMTRNVEQNAGACKRYEHRRAALGDEGERDTSQGHHAQHGADVDKRLTRKVRRNTHGKEPCW